MRWYIVIPLCTFIIVFGILIAKMVDVSLEQCNQLDFTEFSTASCEELSESYKCCSENTITVFQQGNCDQRYSPLIAQRCMG